MRSPLLVGFLNFFFPGLGYMLLGKRLLFGRLIFLSTLLGEIHLWIDPLPDVYIYGSTNSSVALGTIALFLGCFAFGYDAYTLANKVDTDEK